MTRRYESGTADSALEVLTSPEDVEDSGLEDVEAGENALVIGNPRASAYAIVGAPGDLRRFASRVTATVEEALGGEAMPSEVDGLPVMSVLRQLPHYGSLASTWLVILREDLDPSGNKYRLCRVRRAGPPGQWEVLEAQPGAESLTWARAAMWFARIAAIEAAPPDDAPLQEDRHLAREV
jgi:hypothetical protein